MSFGLAAVHTGHAPRYGIDELVNLDGGTLRIGQDYPIRKPSPHWLIRPVDGAGKCAVHINVDVSQKRPKSVRRVRPANSES